MGIRFVVGLGVGADNSAFIGLGSAVLRIGLSDVKITGNPSVRIGKREA